MSKVFQKYFIAIVPEGQLQEDVTDLKLQLKEKFNLKYALKSPAHITLKMPFSWNAAKEDNLKSRLRQFFNQQSGFELRLNGIGKFSRRVIYVKVGGQLADLKVLQENLASTCKANLKLKVELSDYAYHPHMTLAFKDLKDQFFEEYISFLRSIGFHDTLEVKEVALLKKEIGRWVVCHRFPLNAAGSK
ncbi:MAG: 2'-5' RNA ligase family protein [Anditalea sp.]